MAITKLTDLNDVPASTADWTALKALVAALAKASQNPRRVYGLPGLAQSIVQGSVFYVGGSIYLASANESITDTESEYVKLTVSEDGLTLTASYVADLTGVSWNSEYSGYYDDDGNLYVFDEIKAVDDGELEYTRKEYSPLGEINPSWFPAFIAALGDGWLAKFAAEGGSPSGATASSVPAGNAIDRYFATDTGPIPITSFTYVKVRSFLCPIAGAVSLTWTLVRTGAGEDGTAYGRIYVNGVARGPEQSTNFATGEKTITETISGIVAGDTIEVWLKASETPACGSSNGEMTIRAQLTEYLGAFSYS